VAVEVAVLAAPAQADEDTASAFVLSIKPSSRLLPILHATERVAFPQDGREYDYSTKGYLKVAGRTVARLGVITGHADATPQRVRVPVTRQARHAVNAAARKRGTRKVTLVLVHRIVKTKSPQGDQSPSRETITQQVPLVVPRG
jgi:hypothetical protein